MATPIDETAGTRPEDRRRVSGKTPRSILMSMSVLERTQDVVSIVVGVSLVLLSASLLIAGIYDFFDRLSTMPLVRNATNLLDQVLLVLILVEIVHTVVLSLRAHTLVPQPFIVVGLVAVIRKLLFVLGNSQPVSSAELALYIAMVAVFVASLVVVHVFTGRSSALP